MLQQLQPKAVAAVTAAQQPGGCMQLDNEPVDCAAAGKEGGTASASQPLPQHTGSTQSSMHPPTGDRCTGVLSQTNLNSHRASYPL